MSPTLQLTIERTVLSVFLLACSFGLLALAMTNSNASQYFTAVVALVGPLCGSTVQWWFRINGTTQDHADKVQLAQAGATQA